jgi:hypothetical protein
MSTDHLMAQLAGLSDLWKPFAEQNKEIFERLRPAMDESLRLQKQFAARIAPFSNSIKRGLTGGRPKFDKPLKTLAENGWFISWRNTPVAWIYPLARLFEGKQREKGNRRLRDHFKKQVNSIESRLFKLFPRRAPILRRAFEAHRRHEYELSIPVFLIQADGIARAIIGGDIYSRHSQKREHLKSFLDQISFDEFQREIIELILLPIPLNASTGDKTLVRGVLTRHEILHGIRNNYASATNSYRAISWLQFVAEFEYQKDFARRHQQEKKGSAEKKRGQSQVFKVILRSLATSQSLTGNRKPVSILSPDPYTPPAVHVQQMDSVDHIGEMQEVGQTLAQQKVKAEHFAGFPAAS